jgi:hypothetical protein
MGTGQNRTHMIYVTPDQKRTATPQAVTHSRRHVVFVVAARAVQRKVITVIYGRVIG